jgi:hypothetical protein
MVLAVAAVARPGFVAAFFWALIAVTSLVLAAVVLTYVVVVRLPRRRLVYEIGSAQKVSVENLGPDFRNLANPYLIQLRLANRGRTDISSSAFDSGAPIRFDLGVDIVTLTKVVSTPPSAPSPPVVAVGNSVQVGPGLILKGQKLAITVLAEGSGYGKTAVRSSLVNVAVKLQDPATPSLTEQAQMVSEALNNVRQLFEDLEAEVKARSAVVERLTGEAYQAEVRAEEALKRASLNEQEAKAVDAWLDRALQRRLSELERTARRREWLLATIISSIIGLAVGVIAIVFAHFFLGL